MAALRWKQDFAERTDAKMAIATQFAFEAAPIIAWAERPAAAGIDPAGPYRRRGPGEAADADQVRHRLRRRPVAEGAAEARDGCDQAAAALRADRGAAAIWPRTRPRIRTSTSRRCISSRSAASRPTPNGRSTAAPRLTGPHRRSHAPRRHRSTTHQQGQTPEPLMTRTVLESKSKTAVIGFDEPFCVIGERINPTGRKKLAAELERAISRPSRPTRWRRWPAGRRCST
jgi:hypothetical protein